MLILCILLLVFFGVYLFFLLREIRKITKQLNYISKEETNAELVSTSKIFLIRQLLDANNQVIRKNKIYYREQKNKEKQVQQLLSNLTHDLKTPLTVSSGYTQFLLKDKSLQDKHEMLKKIDTSLASISHYLGYLMQYNLIQEKGIELQLELLNLSELVKEELFTHYEEFEEKGFSLVININDNERLISDATVIKRIIQNALGNILKHGSNFAEVNVSSTEEKVTIEFENGFQGRALNSEKLFQRFVTEDLSRTNKSTGLGLAIVKELADLINAKVQIETENERFNLKVILLNNQKE